MKKLCYILFLLGLLLALTACGGNGGVQAGNGIQSDHVHCVCVGKAVGVGEHSACTNKDGWVEVATAEELNDAIAVSSTNKPAYLCLTDDITVDGYMQVAGGENAYICLNGKKLNTCIRAEGNLTITDCVGTGTVVGDKAYTLRTYTGAAVNVFGGTFTVTGDRDDVQIFLVDSSGTSDLMTSDVKSVVNFYNGKIQAIGKTTKAGHCVYLSAYGVLNMYGGIICDGYVEALDTENRFGGNICVYGNSSKFAMYGGEVKNGTAVYAAGKDSSAAAGGNIYVYSGGLYVVGGTISGGHSNGYGGNIATKTKPTEIVFKNCTITGGIAEGQYGGNLYLNGASEQAVFENASITNGKCVTMGANVFLNNAKLVTFKDCTISGGTNTAPGSTSKTGGNGITLQGKGFTVELKGNMKFENNMTSDILTRYYEDTQSWLSIAELATTSPITVACAKRMEFTTDTVANHPFVAVAGMKITEIGGKLVIDKAS